MGCHTPVGALARIDDEEIVFSGYIQSEKNGKILRKTIRSSQENALITVSNLAREFRSYAGK